MTFDPRARAREIATKAYSTADTYSRIGQHLSAVSAIESALLAFAREVLTQEPQREKDAAVMHMTAKLCALPEDENERISRSDAMELIVQWRMKWDAAKDAPCPK